MKNILGPRLYLILFLIFAGALSRLIPHPYNFTGIAAIALFSGAQFRNRGLAFLVPIVAMLLTDMVIGFHELKDMLAVYACFSATVLLGTMLQNKSKVITVIGASLFSSILFYLVTNFSVWPGNALYSQDLSGLFQSYLAGIPFFRNQVLGDLFYNAVFFGGFYLAEMRIPSLKTQSV